MNDASEIRCNGKRTWYGFALLALVLFFLLVGARWIWVYRRGQLFDIDEAGYLAIAVSDYHAFNRGGIAGWLSAVLAPSALGPLTTALASLLFLLTGPRVIVGFAIPLLAGTGCIVATYFLGQAVASRTVGLAAAVLVASCPVMLSYSRSFHFSPLAALVCTVMVFALVKSDRCSRTGSTAVFGVLLGLLPLTRTMTIAFIPGVLIAAFAYTVVSPIERARRLAILSGSLLLAVLTAGIWLGTNGRVVYDYLSSFGYGTRAVEFGADTSRFGFDSWLNMLRALCNHDVYLPHLLVIMAGGIGTVVAACVHAARTPTVSFLQRVARSSILPVVIVIAEALLALTSTRDKAGSAFFAPIVPLLFVVTVWALLAVSAHAYYRRTLTLILATIAIMTTAPFFDLQSRLARPRSADVPVLGSVALTDGRGVLQSYAAAGGFGPVGVAEAISREAATAWTNVERTTAASITRKYAANTVVAFGFRHRFFNVNSIRLQQLLSTGFPFLGQQVEPIVTGDSVQGYLSWLTGEGAAACVLLTSDTARGQFAPLVTPAYMREAAEWAGFIPIEQWSTPDAQLITLSKHRIAPPHCGELTRDSADRVTMVEVNDHLVTSLPAGFIEVVTRAEHGVSIVGWAADRATVSPAAAVHVFVNGTNLLAVVPDVARPDVSKALGSESQELFGFNVLVRPLGLNAAIKIFAQMHDGAFVELVSLAR